MLSVLRKFSANILVSFLCWMTFAGLYCCQSLPSAASASVSFGGAGISWRREELPSSPSSASSSSQIFQQPQTLGGVNSGIRQSQIDHHSSMLGFGVHGRQRELGHFESNVPRFAAAGSGSSTRVLLPPNFWEILKQRTSMDSTTRTPVSLLPSTPTTTTDPTVSSYAPPEEASMKSKLIC